MKVNPADFYILVVDDEESIREVLKDLLQEKGYHVATAGSGEEALTMLQKGLPHIVITDIRMPGISGLELIKKIRDEISEEVQLVIMTSHASIDTAIEAMRIGAYDYLTKPFNELEDVIMVIERTARQILLTQQNQFLLEETHRQNIQLEAMNEDLLQLNEYAKSLAERIDRPKDVLGTGVSGMGQAIRPLPAVFFRCHLAKRQLTAQAFSNIDEKLCVGVSIPLKSSTGEDATKEIQAIPQSDMFRKLLTDSFRIQNFWARALSSHNSPLGIIVLESVPPFTKREEQVLVQYVNHFGTSLSNALLHQQVLDMATLDWLTGIYNVRTFRDLLDSELKRAFRLRHPLSILFMDIDNFKHYNDAHGHPMGDGVIRNVAKLLKESFRSQDLVGRYGGEEFVVALTHTDFESAMKKAESFRKLVEETPFEKGEMQPLGKISVSIGVASYPVHGNTVETLLKVADDALYESKSKGRNRTTGAKVDGQHVPSFSMT